MARDSLFSRRLISWFNQNKRNLPWRHTRDPYKIWISEVMLQQTTVNAVIPYYERWIKIFPDMQSVRKAPLQKVLRLWQGLGYYARAKNIHKSAKLICDAHGGEIPDNAELLRKFPGFGAYTTGAVLSIAFGKKIPIIDANVRRVIMRQLAMAGHADTAHDKKISAFLEDVFPREGAGDFNQALMELGALICRSRTPLCLACPVRNSCKAYERGVQEIIPEPKKVLVRDVRVVVALIRNGKKYFIQKRSSLGLFADLWEFPGGKIEKGESENEALRREVREELGVKVSTAHLFMRTHHFYTQFKAHLAVYLCDVESSPKIDSTHRWVNPADLAKFPMLSGSAKIVERLTQ